MPTAVSSPPVAICLPLEPRTASAACLLPLELRGASSAVSPSPASVCRCSKLCSASTTVPLTPPPGRVPLLELCRASAATSPSPLLACHSSCCAAHQQPPRLPRPLCRCPTACLRLSSSYAARPQSHGFPRRLFGLHSGSTLPCRPKPLIHPHLALGPTAVAAATCLLSIRTVHVQHISRSAVAAATCVPPPPTPRATPGFDRRAAFPNAARAAQCASSRLASVVDCLPAPRAAQRHPPLPLLFFPLPPLPRPLVLVCAPVWLVLDRVCLIPRSLRHRSCLQFILAYDYRGLPSTSIRPLAG